MVGLHLGLTLGSVLGGAGAAVLEFVSTWKTDNPGTSNDDQITLPLESSGTYDFHVDWGDGNSDDIAAYDDAAVTHTFTGGAGTYEVTITDTIDGWRFNDGGNKLKITDISRWGPLRVGSSGDQFNGCANLDVSTTDALVTTGVTGVGTRRMFRACTSLTSINISDTSAGTSMRSMFQDDSSLASLDILDWDTSSVTDMSFLFQICSGLNPDISGFVVTALTAANNMMNLSGFTQTNYDLMLPAWEAQAVKDSVSFHAGNAKYGAGAPATARAALINDHSWTITDGGAA